MAISLDNIELGELHQSIFNLFGEKPLYEIICDLEKKYFIESTSLTVRQCRPIIANLKSKEKLHKESIEFFGNLNLDIPDLKFGVTFLAGRPPKSYINNYLKFSEKHKAILIVLIEDSLARLKYSRSKSEQAKITELYKKQLVNYKVILSSKAMPFVIPQYILTFTKNLRFVDFFEFLEYSKRSVKYATLFDIIHFLWALTIYSSFNPDYWLSSKNSKVHFQLQGKITKISRNMIFLPTEKNSDIKYDIKLTL